MTTMMRKMSPGHRGVWLTRAAMEDEPMEEDGMESIENRGYQGKAD